jgi:outer membrane protein assembly factor BamB
MYKLIDKISGVRQIDLMDSKLILTYADEVRVIDDSGILFQRKFDSTRIVIDILPHEFSVIDGQSISFFDRNTFAEQQFQLRESSFVTTNHHVLEFNEDKVGGPGVFKLYDLNSKEEIWTKRTEKRVRFNLLITNEFFAFVDIENESLSCHDITSGELKWTWNVAESNEQHRGWEIYTIKMHKDTIVVLLRNASGSLRDIAALDTQSGKLKWQDHAYSFVELHNNKLYNLEFYGRFRILDLGNGRIERETDLKQEFERLNIQCEARFNVTNTHIYFKYGIRGKFGILNLQGPHLEEVHQLPTGNTLSTEEYPVPLGTRLYVPSWSKKNLFVYEENS